jgi:hypothetical protein
MPRRPRIAPRWLAPENPIKDRPAPPPVDPAEEAEHRRRVAETRLKRPGLMQLELVGREGEDKK